MQLKHRVHCALWFAETFGLEVSTIKFKDAGTKEREYIVDYWEKAHSKPSVSADWGRQWQIWKTH